METRLKEVLWEGEEIRWSGRPKPFGLLDKALRPSIMLTWISSAVVLLAVAVILAMVGSPYLGWDYSAPETAVMGVAIHAFEWGFVRLAPFVLIAAAAGVFLTWKRG